MAQRVEITVNELLDALAAVAPSSAPADAKTTRELVASSRGQTAHAVTRALRQLHAEGRLIVHHVYRTGYDGVSRSTRGYTILPKKRNKR